MNYAWLAAVAVIGLPIVFLKFSDQFGAACIVLLGIWLLGDSIGTQRDMKALTSSGRTAVVAPVGDTYTEITKVRSGSKTYKARIAFQTTDGKTFTEEATIPQDVLEKFKAGAKVEVTYLPTKPGVYRFNPLGTPGNDDILMSLAIIVAGSLWIGFKRLKASAPAQA